MQKRKRITYLFEEINGKIKNNSKKNSQKNNRNFSNPLTNYYCIWNYLIKIKTLIIAIKRFSVKLIIPKGVFAYPPIHAQFNFNLSK